MYNDPLPLLLPSLPSLPFVIVNVYCVLSVKVIVYVSTSPEVAVFAMELMPTPSLPSAPVLAEMFDMLWSTYYFVAAS